MTTIFDPIKLGDLELSNRIIMAPLTRCRADAGRVPNALMAEYYVQRASAGLILSEATSVTPLARFFTEAIFWRAAITAGVKAAGFIYVAIDLEGYRSGSMHEVLSIRPAPRRAPHDLAAPG